MKTVTSGGSTVEYTYAKNGQLTSIKSPGSSPTYNFVYDKWGNNTEVKVGSQTLVTNTYKSNNGLLTQQKYGNEFTVGHNYDSLDRETSRSYNGTTKFYWTYNADGNLARYSENGNRVLTYLYDDIGRLLQVSGNDGSYVKTSYDKLDKSTDLHYKFNGQRRDVYFHYSDKDNLPLDVKFGTGTAYAVTNLYDGLTRVYEKDYTLVGNTSNSKLKAEYSYVDWSGNNSDRTTGTVRGINYTFAANGLSTHDRWYTYDNVGNILTECRWISSSSKPVQESYTYDAKNQLVRHDSVTQNCTITYAYDAGGNITSKSVYAYTTGDLTGKTATDTVSYDYGNDAWKDELTSYDGEAIEYDEIGNPELYRGWGMTWQGRQLTKAVKDKTVTYTYDSEGIRTSKTVGSTTTKYLLNGTQILAQKTGSTTLSFFYDQQGNRVGMADGSNKFYYYIYNLQGDVIALADASTGKLAVTYTYDAWGKLIELKDTTANSVGTQNPFRYKGYYYDTETSLYYLQSRYYDPDTGRFISADGQLNEGVLGYNMFAYCENNPINGSDPNGDMVWWAAAALGGAAFEVASYLIGNAISGQKSTWGGAAKAALKGAIEGVAFGAIGKGIQAAGKAYKAAKATKAAKAAKAAKGAKAVKTAEKTTAISNGACFVAGTPVLTSDGYISIENVKVGEKVWSKNELTGEKSLKEVVRTFVNETHELVHVYVNGEEIVATPEHPFYVTTKGWVGAGELRHGDILSLQSGGVAAVGAIWRELLDVSTKVYNFEVEDYHTYYVGESTVLVHNVCGVRNTPDQEAVINIAREYKNGISRADANTLVGWADEYGLNFHYPTTHPGRSGMWSEVEHIKVFNLHIPVID